MKHLFILVVVFLSLKKTNAQVGIGTNSPNPSAALDISDSTKGILIPRLSTAEREAIANPAEGLMVYQTDGIKGFWYFDGNSWKPIFNSTNNTAVNGGKTTLILTDTITNVQAQVKIATEVGPNTQEIKITGCKNLTSVDLSGITSIVDIFINENPLLTNVNLGNLTECVGGKILVQYCPQLSSLNLHSLKYVSNKFDALVISNTNLTSIVLDSLQKINGDFEISYNPALYNISLNRLTDCGVFTFLYNNNLNNINANNLISCQRISLIDCPQLVSFNLNSVKELKDQSTSLGITRIGLPNLTFNSLANIAGPIYISENSNLVGISFPALKKWSSTGSTWGISSNPNLSSINFDALETIDGNPSISLYFNKLPSSQINYLLNKFVTINPPLHGTYHFSLQNPVAPPTGQGIIDKATLISRGNNVLTD